MSDAQGGVRRHAGSEYVTRRRQERCQLFLMDGQARRDGGLRDGSDEGAGKLNAQRTFYADRTTPGPFRPWVRGSITLAQPPSRNVRPMSSSDPSWRVVMRAS